MKEHTKFVGLDVHKESIAVSVATDMAHGGEVRYLGEVPNTPVAVLKLIRQLKKEGAKLRCCYEAGPCGYGLHRQLLDLGEDCQVVAPSLIPRKAGDRIKTDRRDSMTLARLHRAGELTMVCVPGPAQEALRDLTRAREDVSRAERRAKQQLNGFLLRHGRIYPSDKDKWTKAHFRWLEGVKFDQPLQQIVFQEYVDLVQSLGRRVAALDKEIEKAVAVPALAPIVKALMALRGVNRLTAAIVVAEVGDLRRFSGAPEFMAFLGLVPSEHSSGGSKVRGHITKTGNGHVRRVLVEAAWSYRFQARKTAHLQRKAERTTPEIQDIAWAAQKRMCGRYALMVGRGKVKNQVCTAIARELAGFIWAIGQITPPYQA